MSQASRFDRARGRLAADALAPALKCRHSVGGLTTDHGVAIDRDIHQSDRIRML